LNTFVNYAELSSIVVYIKILSVMVDVLIPLRKELEQEVKDVPR
jgi:hypothetical protein